MKSSIVRFGVSLEKDLLNRCDKYVYQKRYDNRSNWLREKKCTLISEPQAVVTHFKRDTILSILGAHWNWNIYWVQRLPVNFHNFI